MRAIDQSDVVAEFLDAVHIVGREDDGGTGIAEFEDFALDDGCIDGVEAGEWLIEDQELGIMEHGNDKLNLLRQTLGEFLDLFVPPVADLKAFEPLLEAGGGVALGEAFEASEEDGLLADLHLLVEATLLREVTDVVNILSGEGVTIECKCALVGGSDMIDDTDKSGLTCTIRAEEAIDLATRHLDAYIIESGVAGISLGDVICTK